MKIVRLKTLNKASVLLLLCLLISLINTCCTSNPLRNEAVTRTAYCKFPVIKIDSLSDYCISLGVKSFFDEEVHLSDSTLFKDELIFEAFFSLYKGDKTWHIYYVEKHDYGDKYAAPVIGVAVIEGVKVLIRANKEDISKYFQGMDSTAYIPCHDYVFEVDDYMTRDDEIFTGYTIDSEGNCMLDKKWIVEY